MSAKVGSRRAFITMQFGDENLNRVYENCFKTATLAAGFTLFRLDEGQGAGLIDDQLLVAIRTSKFLIADLSLGNRGAYWEAGFAEGLSRPVICVCEKSVWGSNEQKPHFDTAHLNTVVWSYDDLPSANRRLTAMIRNTFPADAKLTDDD